MGRNLGKAALKRYQAKGRNGYIRVWKVVNPTKGKYVPEAEINRILGLYKTGFNHARKNALDEDELIHAFRNLTSARSWASAYQNIIECLIEPGWIVAVGDSYSDKTLTTKAIVMPEFPKTKVTVREFRVAIKGKKVKTYSWES